MFSKERLIFQKEKTITDELCDDIIMIFDKELLNNNCIICNNGTFLDIENNPLYIRITNILGIEILKLYNKYLSNVDSSFTKIPNLNYNFKIKKMCYSDNNILYNNINTKLIQHTNKVKLLHYIFFLNDYDGEYIFFTPFDSQSESFSTVITQSEIGVMNEKRPNNYAIKPKKGSVLIFPVSIHFSYTENIKLFESKYIIEGYLYL